MGKLLVWGTYILGTTHIGMTIGNQLIPSVRKIWKPLFAHVHPGTLDGEERPFWRIHSYRNPFSKYMDIPHEWLDQSSGVVNQSSFRLPSWYRKTPFMSGSESVELRTSLSIRTTAAQSRLDSSQTHRTSCPPEKHKSHRDPSRTFYSAWNLGNQQLAAPITNIIQHLEFHKWGSPSKGWAISYYNLLGHQCVPWFLLRPTSIIVLHDGTAGSSGEPQS